MKFYLLDYCAATENDVYKELSKAWKDVYIIMLSEVWGFGTVCAIWSQLFFWHLQWNKNKTYKNFNCDFFSPRL